MKITTLNKFLNDNNFILKRKTVLDKNNNENNEVEVKTFYCKLPYVELQTFYKNKDIWFITIDFNDKQLWIDKINLNILNDCLKYIKLGQNIIIEKKELSFLQLKKLLEKHQFIYNKIESFKYSPQYVKFNNLYEDITIEVSLDKDHPMKISCITIKQNDLGVDYRLREEITKNILLNALKFLKIENQNRSQHNAKY